MSAAEGPRALLLDALGTLLWLEPPAPRLRAELARRFAIELSESEAAGAIAAEIAYYRAHLDEGRDSAGVAALRRRCAGIIRSSLPALAGVDGDELTEALLASLHFHLYEDVRPALEQAREHGYLLVVASNWDASLNSVLDRLGLAPLLDGIVTSAVAGSRKPDGGIFARALSIAGVAPDRAVHVGDSFEEDVIGARGAGIEPVLIRRDGDGPQDGVRTIATLADLL